MSSFFGIACRGYDLISEVRTGLEEQQSFLESRFLERALLASDFSQGNYLQSRKVTSPTLQIGLTSGVSLAVILFLGFGSPSSLFTSDSNVLEVARSGTLFVAGSQPMNTVAFVLDGLYYGVSDFGYAAYSMVLIGLISSVFVLLAAPLYGLAAVWAGLYLFMTLRVVAGIWRLGTKGGPWKLVWSKVNQKSSRVVKKSS